MTKNNENVFGLTAEEQLAVETLYRAFNEGNPDLLDEAVTADWQDIPLAPQQIRPIGSMDELDTLGTRGESGQRGDWWRSVINAFLELTDGTVSNEIRASPSTPGGRRVIRSSSRPERRMAGPMKRIAGAGAGLAEALGHDLQHFAEMAEDVTDTLNPDLEAAGDATAKVSHRPRLLSDNGPWSAMPSANSGAKSSAGIRHRRTVSCGKLLHAGWSRAADRGLYRPRQSPANPARARANQASNHPGKTLASQQNSRLNFQPNRCAKGSVKSGRPTVSNHLTTDNRPHPLDSQRIARGELMTSTTTTPSITRIIVVEDDSHLRILLTRILRENGFQVTGVRDGREMWDALAIEGAELIILDIMLPGSNGLDLCRELRARTSTLGNTVILMLTARGEELDRVLGLELGADDYVCKPFSQRELLARIRAVLRRAQTQPDGVSENQLRPDRWRFGGWQLDMRRRELLDSDGSLIELSGAEYDLLVSFIQNARRVIGRSRLIELSRARLGESSDRSIDVLVSRLRRKLAGETGGQMIRTIRGTGYMFDVDAEQG